MIRNLSITVYRFIKAIKIEKHAHGSSCNRIVTRMFDPIWNIISMKT